MIIYYAWFVQIMEESMKQIVRGMQKKVLHKYKKWCIIMFDKCINMQQKRLKIQFYNIISVLGWHFGFDQMIQGMRE